MKSKLSISNSMTKSLVVFLGLLIFSGFLVNRSYKNDLINLNLQAQDVVILQSEKVLSFLESLKTKAIYWQENFEKWESFNKAKYLKEARVFRRITPTVMAFNFISSDYKIAEVYPLEINERALGKNILNHPDQEMRQLLSKDKGLSRDELTFTPPVELLRGGKAMVIFVPVTFRNGTYGWFNILIQIDQTLSSFLKTKLPLKADISIVDEDSGRYLYISGNKKTGDEIVECKVDFLGRSIIFYNNIQKNIVELRQQYLSIFILILFILVLLSLSLFHYFRKNDQIVHNLVSVESEKNLLRILFHDLANPLSIVQLYGLTLEKKHPNEEGIPKMLLKIEQMIEVITSIRHLDFLNREVTDLQDVKVNFNELFSNLIEINSDLITNKNLKLTVLNDFSIEKILKIPYELFKNEIINNLLTNALKFSYRDSQVTVEVMDHFIKFTNKSDPIDKSVLKDLNEVRPTESRSVKQVGKGHGLGFFIAKILATKFNLRLQIEQNLEKKEVYTSLYF